MLTQENIGTRLLLKGSPQRIRFAVRSSDLSAPVAVNVFSGDDNSPFFVSMEHVDGILDDTKFEDLEVVFGVDDRIELTV